MDYVTAHTHAALGTLFDEEDWNSTGYQFDSASSSN